MEVFEALQLPFMQRAIMGGVVVALLCALLGIFVTLRRESFLSDAVAHASLSGVAIALLLSIEPIPIALLVGITMSVGITYLKKHTKISTDALIGIFYSILFALGIIIINTSPSFQPELGTYLFGSILSINKTDISYAFITFIVTAIVMIFSYKKLVYSTFDPESAFLKGIKVDQIDYLIGILASITIIISIKIVGIILVTALLVIPATTAKLTAKNFGQMIPISLAQSIFSVVSGILLSYFLDTPTGATIVLFSGLTFILIFIISRIGSANSTA